MSGEVQPASRAGTVLGTALVILGLLAMLSPLLFGLTVTLLVAVVLMAAGVARLVWAFGAGSFGRGTLTFLLGGLMIVAALVMLARPLLALVSLTLVLGTYLLADGAMDIIGAIRIRRSPGWTFMLVAGVVSLLLGLVMWRQWPISGTWAVGTLVGVRLIFAGVEMMAVTGAATGRVEVVQTGQARPKA